MGFDLSGMNPNMTSPQPELPPMGKDWGDEEWKLYAKYEAWQNENCGVHFRSNVWWWRPLWHFVTTTCDDILTEKDIGEGSFNNGHKISKTKAGKIAKRLYSLIESGKVKEYEEGYKEHLASLEKTDCKTCDATGMRVDPKYSTQLTKSINELETTTRVHNCLQSRGIRTVGELVEMEEIRMFKIKNFGRKSLTELTEKLMDLGLHFKQSNSSSVAGKTKCNMCNGTGMKDDWAKSYPFDADNVRKFANFCANSGGFRIC